MEYRASCMVYRVIWRHTYYENHRPMIRTMLALILSLFAGSLAAGQATDVVVPTTYQVAINGEVFEITLGEPITVKSRQQPDLQYDISLRVAPLQHLRLNTLQLSYDRGCRVSDDHKQGARTITLGHDLGFTMIVGDLSGTIDPADRPRVLRLLVKRMVQSFRPKAEKEPTVSKIARAAFKEMSGRVVSIQYRDMDGYDRTCVVYLLVDDDHACSCIVQYLDEDAVAIAPLVKQILDSIRPL